MKINKVECKKEFQPIKIEFEIESETELVDLWMRLNATCKCIRDGNKHRVWTQRYDMFNSPTQDLFETVDDYVNDLKLKDE